MSSTHFEPDGSSSVRRLYIQLWYSVFYMQYQLIPSACKQTTPLLISNSHRALNSCILPFEWFPWRLNFMCRRLGTLSAPSSWVV